MSHTPQPQVPSQNVRMLIQDLTPPTPTPPRHHRRPTEALTTVYRGLCRPAQKIRISGFGVKNKPKIRICQSGTDMQTLITAAAAADELCCTLQARNSKSS